MPFAPVAQSQTAHLAKELGFAPGGINFCLQVWMEKGRIKIHNFSHSNNKLRHTYLPTPARMAEKSKLIVEFSKRKVAEYETRQAEINALSSDPISARKAEGRRSL